jgi:hypothetical protein
MEQGARKEIIRAGIAAPSADNSQPWLFRWRGDTLDVAIDPSRSGGVSDARYVLSDLAAGACIENLLVRAQSLGFDCTPRLFPGEDALSVAELAFEPSAGRDEPLAAAIPERHTDRRFPWRGPLGADIRRKLAAHARQRGIRLQWCDAGVSRRRALGILHRAEALRFASPRLHAELFSSVRFDVGWHHTASEGLSPAALAVEAPVRPVFLALRRRGVMGFANRLGGAALMGYRSAALPARLSPGLCLLSTPGSARVDVIALGRALERVWLCAALDNLSVQPFAAAGVFALDFLDLESAFKAQSEALRERIRALDPEARALIFLRLGRSRSPAHKRSGRRDPGTFRDR